MQQRNRMQWASNYQKRDNVMWERTIFSDESSFTLCPTTQRKKYGMKLTLATIHKISSLVSNQDLFRYLFGLH